MFALHTVNRTELLFQQLDTILHHYSHGPFDPLHFLIQGRGMERWLQMRLAERQGICAMARFDFPNRFFATLAADLGLRLNDVAFERHRLTWLIDQLLGEPPFQTDPALRRYLQGPGPQLRRFQLARQLAQLFDQYQIQRPDWLAAWQRGERTGENLDPQVERWQAALWRRLYRQLGGHRGELWQALIRRLQEPLPGTLLPQAVFLFGVGFLPRLMVEVLAALARHTDVHLLLLTPVDGYWADLPGKRARALAMIRQDPDLEWDSRHHPLLVSLGRRGAQFQRLLLETVEPTLESACFYRHPEPEHLLHHLQNDLADGVLTRPAEPLPVTIELHRCHTPLREVEVARDCILARLQADPELKLEDIAVMAPDIGAYQPYLEAVFADLPHHIADRTLGRRNGLLEVLVAALELLAGRFEWEAVLELLGRPLVRERFGLSPWQLPQLERWVRDCAIRWGLDGRQRESLGLPPVEHNSWRIGVDRMILGWMAASDEAWQDIMPYAEVEGQMGAALLKLADFVQVLQRFWRRWQQPLPLHQWQETLSGFIEALFAETAETLAAREALAQLLETLPDSEEYPAAVELAVITDWLRSRVEEVVSDDFLSGGITCCTLLPMRSVPFRLTVVVGLSEGAFPQRETPPTFDLLTAHPRLGDRSLRLDQRYQFLELLLSTRDCLILTYQGLTPEKNEPLPPAQVVSELIDTLDHYGIGRDQWIFDHPSHPFHPDYFREGGPLPTPDPDRFAVARAMLRPGRSWQFWPGDFELNDEPVEDLDFAELFDFYRDAQSWFCKRRLQLHQINREMLPDPREPFGVDGLTAWRMRCQILEALWMEADPVTILRRAQLAGEWPQGEAGRQRFEQERRLAQLLHQAASGCGAGATREPRWHEVEVAGLRLYGKLDKCHQQGNLLVEPGKLCGKYLFRAWLYHLLAQSLEPSPTWLVSLAEDRKRKDEVVVRCFEPCDNWRELLTPWVTHFLRHWRRPSHWLPEWGWHWLGIHRAPGGKKPLSPRQKAEKWRRKCLDAGVTESYALLFGDTLTEDRIESLRSDYDSLLREFPD
ncbi:MAG TPA: exodeoxyribonuclease V subunit gamma [Methylothermaceae bacterium]|nr:exodeoxyribonuclease V subunit gamma [Methylothermaceae bacterium]